MGLNTLWIFLGISVLIFVVYKLSIYYALGGKRPLTGGRRKKRKKRKLTSK